MTVQDAEDTRTAWDAIATGYDRTNTPVHMWLAREGLRRAAVGPGMRLLDVAAGSGALSIPAARMGARVVSIDVSASMLGRLEERARIEKLDIETHVMDGHALAFENDTFDIAGSQFGVMLFPDMPRGVRELTRVTRPGGRVLIHAYGNPHEIDFFGFFISAIRAVVPSFDGPPMDPLPLPFQLHDPARLHHEFAAAGLHGIQVETIVEKLTFQSGIQLWDWLVHSNPIVGAVLGILNLTDEQVVAARTSMDELVRQRAAGRDGAVLTNPINIGIGTKR